MKKTALIYSFNTVKSAKIAAKIKDAFQDESLEMLNTEELNAGKFMEYDNLIMGVPTWFDGELPNYWDEFLPELEEQDMKGKALPSSDWVIRKAIRRISWTGSVSWRNSWKREEPRSSGILRRKIMNSNHRGH